MLLVMNASVRRLVKGDEAILELLARDDADFDIPGRGAALAPLPPDAALTFLGNPCVLFWIAESDGVIAGFMYCHIILKRAGATQEILLYEIGVRSTLRGRAIGTKLVHTLYTYMKAHNITDSWVLADNPGAVGFYQACGFSATDPAPTYLQRGQ
jgi:ribosomal protein S18 acetylase RimI-like enzyme